MGWWKWMGDGTGRATDTDDRLPADAPVIRLEGITRVFKGDADEETRALDGVTVEVQRLYFRAICIATQRSAMDCAGAAAPAPRRRPGGEYPRHLKAVTR